jgi:hypothetical protein
LDPLPCDLNRVRTSLQGMPAWDPLLRTAECLSGQIGQEQSLMDSLNPWVPKAPGIWRPLLLQSSLNLEKWTIGNGLALPWALAAMPDLGATDWRMLGEQRLLQADSLAALVLWLRQIASDSMQKPYVTFRLKTFFQEPRMEDAEDKTVASALKKKHDLKIQKWIRVLSAPVPWQNLASIGALETALWESAKPEWALRIFKIGLRQIPDSSHFEPWMKAVGQLWNLGASPLAWEALQQAEAHWRQRHEHKPSSSALSDPAGLEARHLALALTVTRGLNFPEAAADWARRGLLKKEGKTQSAADAKLAMIAAEACLAVADWTCFEAWGKQIHGASQEPFQLLTALAWVGKGKGPLARQKLQEWKDSPQRTLSNGAVLNAQGWVAGYLGHWSQADSLWTLASAYLDEPNIQATLEMRRGLALDTQSMPAWMKGQFTSPFPISEKRRALSTIPTQSKLWGDAQWLLSRWALAMGETEEAKRILGQLAQQTQNSQSIPAKAALARLLETDHPGQAIAEYENLLVESQQGVPAEFARERLRQLAK